MAGHNEWRAELCDDGTWMVCTEGDVIVDCLSEDRARQIADMLAAGRRFAIECTAAQRFGGGYYGDAVSETTREFYRDLARETVDGSPETRAKPRFRVSFHNVLPNGETGPQLCDPVLTDEDGRVPAVHIGGTDQ